MAIGKNKRRPRKGAAKKKIVDAFSRKDWYDVQAPTIFKNSEIGKTPVNQTVGKIKSRDNLLGRVFRVSLADLNLDEDRYYRTINFIVEDVQGRVCLTNFHSMNFTTDKMKGMLKKWQTTIEARTEVKTTDGYILRLFSVGFTKRRPNQKKVTSYAQSSQVKRIRTRMVDIMKREAAGCSLLQLFQKFIPDVIGKMIENECQGIYPLRDCYVTKAKIIRKPKFDATKLAELHVANKHASEGTPVVEEAAVEAWGEGGDVAWGTDAV